MFSADYFLDWMGLVLALMFLIFMYDIVKWRK